MSTLFKNTLFINLAQRTDRLAHAESEFAKMGINAERINAVKTPNGAVGCTLSHILCLETAKQRGYDSVFICEDDITFTNPELLNTNLALFENNHEIMWDVLIIGGNNVPPYHQFAPSCARVFHCRTTTGYIVKKDYYDTLIENFKTGLNGLMREPNNRFNFALDMYWQQLQKQDFWYMITPPTVTQYQSWSDIEERPVNYEGLLLDMDKSWLKR